MAQGLLSRLLLLLQRPSSVGLLVAWVCRSKFCIDYFRSTEPVRCCMLAPYANFTVYYGTLKY
jgi:hypothetical protein